MGFKARIHHSSSYTQIKGLYTYNKFQEMTELLGTQKELPVVYFCSPLGTYLSRDCCYLCDSRSLTHIFLLFAPLVIVVTCVTHVTCDCCYLCNSRL